MVEVQQLPRQAFQKWMPVTYPAWHQKATVKALTRADLYLHTSYEPRRQAMRGSYDVCSALFGTAAKLPEM